MTISVGELREAFARGDGAAIGRAYADLLRVELARWTGGPAPDSDLQDWLMMVWDGMNRDDLPECIDEDLWCSIVIAAADAATEAEIWSVGDGPANHLVKEYPGAALRLHRARANHPGVEAMFRSVLAARLSEGEDEIWWGDGRLDPLGDDPE